MSEVHIVARGLGFPEGPVAMADGSVVLTEINGGWVTRVATDGTVTRLGKAAGGPNGLARAPDGSLILCNNGGSRYLPGNFMGQGPSDDYEYGSVERVDPENGARRLLYKEANGHKLSAPNDLVFDRHGGFYFTDLGKRYHTSRDHGGLYYALPDGSSIREIAYPILSANGVGLSPDETIVYVADTESARLWAFEIEAPGVLRKEPFPSPHGGRCIGSLPGFCRFDSLAVTASGNICVATLVTGQITVFAPDGRVLDQMAMPDTHPTNICFGGSDMRTATITLSGEGAVGQMRWPEPGLKLNFQQ
ncbi:SMP-30/gluconolactonase/LRE family protein [Paracraurococcus lichenis]|uniref:SMP-30/gluconolactonase/LRE family protein n=1 Tax=Paracraurococcus lichenis TaxID=3064888 RepID=A0ABT9EE58_9PROT|nr:SMP-30/gluconolactonase/LRE family protein [Paracraurococcus sp. LOR1-02]MDO9714517.1 SMP-30/gluconolactonase/LRE family protein [Paracraurococcus sp. LOR1-02]